MTLLPFRRRSLGEDRWAEAGSNRPVRPILILFFSVIAIALATHGGTAAYSYHLLFLFLCIPALIAIWKAPADLLADRTLLPFLGLGMLLFLNVFLRGSLSGRGYVVLSLGWSAALLTLFLLWGNPSMMRKITFVLIALGTGEAMIGIVQALGRTNHGLGQIATGTFYNANHFAGLLNICLPFALGIALVRLTHGGSRDFEDYSRIWLLLVASSVIILALVLSLSRGGVSSFLAGLGLMVTLLLLHRRTGRRRFAPLMGGLLLLFMVGLGGWVALDALFTRFSEVPSDRNARLFVYRDSLKLIADHPWGGIGPRMFEWRFRPYQQESPERIYEHAHNDFLQSAVEWGLPTAFLFWSFVFWRLLTISRLAIETRNRDKQALALGCSASIFAFLSHSLVDFNLQIPSNFILFCTVLAGSWVLSIQAHSAERLPHASNENLAYS